MSLKTVSILGCGWLGLPLAQTFIQQGFIVKGSTTRTERLEELRTSGVLAYHIQAEQGSWRGEAIEDFLQCDTLIIAIPPGTRKNSNSAHAIEIKSLLHLIKERNIVIPRVLYISSTSVYKSGNQIVAEEDISDLSDAENIILAEAEQIIQANTSSNTLILRLGGLTGYNRMLARFFAGKKDLAGGNEPVNLLHRDDAIGAIMHILLKDIKNEVFNVCSPVHPEKRLFYTDLCERFGMKSPDFPKELDGDWKLVSTEKIQKTGYAFKFPDPHDYTYS